MKAQPLPPGLLPEFSVSAAHRRGLSRSRLRGRDLEAPFRGVRRARTQPDPLDDRYERARKEEFALIRALAERLDGRQFFSHRSAAMIWGTPVPYRVEPELHLGVMNPDRTPRIRGVTGHCFELRRAVAATRYGLPVLTPGFTFATQGALTVPELVAIGDSLVRVYRPGRGRPHRGRRPIARMAELRGAVELGRWRGAARLREALELVRLDSWSPRESMTRVALVRGGLPEPELNVDIYGERDRFLGCVDMVYARYRVIVEYQGQLHGEQYSRDLERIEGLRAAGWEVVQVTSELIRRPEELVARVRKALVNGGWRG